MTHAKYPTDDDIRAALLGRAAQFTKTTGMAQSAVAKHSVNDPAFFLRLSQGRNFTVSTYQRVMTWLDCHWPDTATISIASSLRSTKITVNGGFCREEKSTLLSS